MLIAVSPTPPSASAGSETSSYAVGYTVVTGLDGEAIWTGVDATLGSGGAGGCTTIGGGTSGGATGAGAIGGGSMRKREIGVGGLSVGSGGGMSLITTVDCISLSSSELSSISSSISLFTSPLKIRVRSRRTLALFCDTSFDFLRRDKSGSTFRRGMYLVLYFSCTAHR